MTITTTFSTTGLESETFSISHTDIVTAQNITYTVEVSPSENSVPLYIFSICKGDKEVFRALYSQSRLDDVISLLTNARGKNTDNESLKPVPIKVYPATFTLTYKGEGPVTLQNGAEIEWGKLK